MKISVNELLDAVLAAGAANSQRPGPDWFTVKELLVDAEARGVKTSDSSMKRGLRKLSKAGKAERREVTGVRGGFVTYWRLTNGHRPAT